MMIFEHDGAGFIEVIGIFTLTEHKVVMIFIPHYLVLIQNWLSISSYILCFSKNNFSSYINFYLQTIALQMINPFQRIILLSLCFSSLFSTPLNFSPSCITSFNIVSSHYLTFVTCLFGEVDDVIQTLDFLVVLGKMICCFFLFVLGERSVMCHINLIILRLCA